MPYEASAWKKKALKNFPKGWSVVATAPVNPKGKAAAEKRAKGITNLDHGVIALVKKGKWRGRNRYKVWGCVYPSNK